MKLAEYFRRESSLNTFSLERTGIQQAGFIPLSPTSTAQCIMAAIKDDHVVLLEKKSEAAQRHASKGGRTQQGSARGPG